MGNGIWRCCPGRKGCLHMGGLICPEMGASGEGGGYCASVPLSRRVPSEGGALFRWVCLRRRPNLLVNGAPRHPWPAAFYDSTVPLSAGIPGGQKWVESKHIEVIGIANGVPHFPVQWRLDDRRISRRHMCESLGVAAIRFFATNCTNSTNYAHRFSCEFVKFVAVVGPASIPNFSCTLPKNWARVGRPPCTENPAPKT
jgi:hypothetical protein